MRWDNLFDDLESQLEQELTAEEVDLLAEEERLRIARLGIRDRLYALHRQASGDPGRGRHEPDAGLGARMLRLTLRDGSRLAVVPSTFGRDWFAGELVEESGRRPSCILPIDAIDGIVLAGDQVVPSLEVGATPESPSALSARLGLQFVLRDLCRRRQPVELQTGQGRIHGTIDRVGRDHLDLAVHEPGRPRRESAVTEYRIVRLGQVLVVRL